MSIQTVGCNQCGLMQTNPRPSAEALDDFYKNSYRSFYQGIKDPGDAYIAEQKKRERFRATVEFLRSNNVLDLRTRVLDVGCSEGTFFSVLRDFGCINHFFGVEPGVRFAEYAASVPNTKIVSSIEEIVGEFELASMVHVLEHHLDPLATIETLLQHLAEGGYLYIDVPDADAYLDINALHIGHIFHFTKTTLQALLYRAGLQIVVMERYSPINHPSSLRVIAKRSDGKSLAQCKFGKNSELATWQRIARFKVWKIVLKRYIHKFPRFVAIYRSVKRAFH